MNVLAALAALRVTLSNVAVDDMSGDDCARLVSELSLTVKVLEGVRVLAAARATADSAHRRVGVRDANEWLARNAGISAGAARATIEVGRALADMGSTREAMLRGDISVAQVREITRTDRECPGSEKELLDVALRSDMKSLKDRARAIRMRSIDPETLRERQERARSFRQWRDELGMVRFSGALLPEVGLPFVNRLDAETGRVRREANRAGRDEPWERHAAEAFGRMIRGEGRGRGRRADVVIVCDIRALRRGHAEGGEPCHIIGSGPVPVSVVRQLSQDAFVKAVLHDGVQIHTVAHYGRHINATVRTALELGKPPEFAGAVCNEVGCGRQYGLEWDHLDPVANGGPTALANLEPKCAPHHQAKSEADRRAGLWHGRERPPGKELAA